MTKRAKTKRAATDTPKPKFDSSLYGGFAEKTLRKLAIRCLSETLEGDPEVPEFVFRYIAYRLLPILEREARRGRPGASRVGERVQVLIDSGKADQKAARRIMAKYTGLKIGSVAKQHQAFVKTGKQAFMGGRVLMVGGGVPLQKPR